MQVEMFHTHTHSTHHRLQARCMLAKHNQRLYVGLSAIAYQLHGLSAEL